MGGSISKFLWVFIPLLALGILLNILIGEIAIPINALLDPSRVYRVIMFDIRMPEVVACIMVGVNLALSGAVMQAVFRNPLAEPYVTGTASGALFGALLGLLVIAVFRVRGLESVTLIPILSFVGSMVATILVIAFGRGGWLSLILAGIAVSIMFSSLVMILDTYIITLVPTIPAVIYLLFGTVSGITWNEDVLMVIVSLPIIAYLLLSSRELNLLMMNDDVAQASGVNPRLLRAVLIVLVGVLTAITVSFTGVIGFVGLMTPHITRFLVGGSDNSRVMPLSLISGSVIMLYANIVSKVLVSGVIMPITAITSLFGVPTLLILLGGARHE
ncbi:MAG: FecCD family ABC transporter permease [Vulcanisaeta sp. AZ3]